MRLLVGSVLCAIGCWATLAAGGAPTAEEYEKPETKVGVDADGAVHLPPMIVPFSSFASPQAKAAYLDFQRLLKAVDRMSVAEQRQWVDDTAHARDREADITPTTIAGVYTDVIAPKDGVARRNRHRVLINLHAGGFLVGRTGAADSIPVANLLKIKVVTIDYRQGPEYKFPAGSEDVAAVYKELLKSYRPKSIGIYGSSAGGVLTAQAIAWFTKENLPSPGAIGILCASADGWAGGDSGSLATALMGETPPRQPADLGPHPSVDNATYFKDADIDDPLVSPIRSPALLARFPPTLIIASTRDPALSPAVYTHTQLVKLGVDAELHVWEGMTHGFLMYPDLPETKEVWDVVARFFDKHLN